MSLEYDKAIDCYTRCLPNIPDSDHNLRTIVLSNRAQCNIKLKNWEAAFSDANDAIKYDPNHLKSIQRRGTAAYHTKRLRQARKDFLHSLSLEFSQQFAEYLQKVNQQIEKAKQDGMERLKRQVLFNSGVDFHGSKDDKDMHPDEIKRRGCEEFKRKSLKITIQEMNIDQALLKQQQEKKEEFLKKQNEAEDQRQDSQRSTEEESPQKKETPKLVETEEPKKKKKKNKKKNKGLSAFMDDEKEADAFKANEGEETQPVVPN